MRKWRTIATMEANRRQRALTTVVLVVGSLSTWLAHAQQPQGDTSKAVLVRTRDLEPEDLQALSGVVRAQLGSNEALRVLDGAPPEEDEEAFAWAVALARREGAAAVFWLVLEDGDTASARIAPQREDRLLQFTVSEPRKFDRLRSLAIGVSSILRELRPPPPAWGADPAQDGKAPTGETARPDSESGAWPPEPPTVTESAPPLAQSSSHGTPRGPSQAALPLQAHTGPRIAVILVPVARLSSDGTALGLDASAAVGVHRHLSLRAGLHLSREETLGSRPETAAARNRVALTGQVLARLTAGAWTVHLGGAVGGAATSVQSVPQGQGGERTTTDALWAPLAGPVAMPSFRLSEALFLELPISAMWPLYHRRAASGARTWPPFELSAGISLGCGTP